MKRVLASVLVALLICTTSNAGNYVPEPRQSDEFDFTYGVLSIPSFAFGFAGIMGTALSFGAAAMDDMSAPGAFTAGWHHYFNNHIAVGAELTFESITLRMKSYTGKDENGNATYNNKLTPSHSNFICLMPSVKASWFNKSHFSMYSKVSAGAMFQFSPSVTYYTEGSDGQPAPKTTEEHHSFGFAVQVNPIGMEFGGLSTRGFLELGWGMQGLIMGGIRYAF